MTDREQMIEIVSNAKKACAKRNGCASCRYKRKISVWRNPLSTRSSRRALKE